MAIIAAAAIAAAGSLASGALSSSAAGSAANAETSALDQALQFEKGVYGTAEGNLNPFINTGKNAIYSLSSLFGLGGAPGQPDEGAQQGFLNFTQLPSYQFPLQQGELAANRGLAAQGLSGSGAAAKALTQFGQGYASQGFNSYIGQLAGLANMGESGATSLGQIGTNVGNLVSGSSNQIAGAQGAGILGQTSGLTQGLSGFLGALTGNSSGLGNSALAGFLGNLGNSSGSAYSGAGTTDTSPAWL